MCLSCWDLEGRPFERTERAAVNAEAFAAADEFGPLHIIVSDWNLDDEDIQFCLKRSDLSASDRGLCEALLSMTEGERWATAILAENPNFDPSSTGLG
jgi:hypothetical protein